MIFPKKLLVEGETDKRIIPYLIEANGVSWTLNDQPIVYIEPYGGIEEILKLGVIGSELKASGLEALGILVDANGDANRRWNHIKGRCEEYLQGLPDIIPASGCTMHQTGFPSFGVWIMPNNRYSGMIEDFLIQLIPSNLESQLELAKNCAEEAKSIGASFKSNHARKAQIHTWLAWQDEPGRQLHQAVHQRILDPEKQESKPFVAWFRSLFRV